MANGEVISLDTLFYCLDTKLFSLCCLKLNKIQTQRFQISGLRVPVTWLVTRIGSDAFDEQTQLQTGGDAAGEFCQVL